MRYAFANCVLDTEGYTLTRDGAAVPVEPQVFDLLALLAENAGKLVSRDQLVEVVWDGRIVSEATIAARINAARRAVGDDGKAQAVIRTIPRRGIELTASVSVDAAVDAAPTPTRQTIRYTASSDGTQIAYGISGDGPPLLRAAHHVTHLELDWNSRLWRPIFDRIGEAHRLIRYDIRGAGLSDDNSEADGLEHHAEDLAAVADAAGLERFPILANLNGAATAIRFAAEHPEGVSRLVIMEGYARGRALREDGPRTTEDDPFYTLLKSGGWGDPANGYMRAWMSMATPGLTHDDLTELIELVGAASSAENTLQSRKVIDLFDARPYLARVEAPTLVVHTRNDVLHPMTEGRMLAAGIKGAEFRVVESANCLCLTPDRTWQEQIGAVLAFLNEA